MQAPEKEDEGWTGYSIIDLTDLDPQSDPEDFVDLTLETQPAEQEKRPWNEQPGGEADRPWDLTKDDKDTLAPKPIREFENERNRIAHIATGSAASFFITRTGAMVFMASATSLTLAR